MGRRCRAVRQYRFTSEQRTGKPVAVHIPVHFGKDGESQEGFAAGRLEGATSAVARR